MGWRVFLYFTPSVWQNNVDWRVEKYRSRVVMVSPLQDIRVGSTYRIFSAQDKSILPCHISLVSLCTKKFSLHYEVFQSPTEHGNRHVMSLQLLKQRRTSSS
jgi:hypothetical protein